MPDTISPIHYKHGSMETIDIIKAMTGEGYEAYLKGNIIKYLDRYKYKNGAEDLKKASTYLGFLIDEQPENKKEQPIEITQTVKTSQGIACKCTEHSFRKDGHYCNKYKMNCDKALKTCNPYFERVKSKDEIAKEQVKPLTKASWDDVLYLDPETGEFKKWGLG